MSTSDGSTADYYQLPPGSTELQHLISHRDMNAQIGEIFRACYRYGIASHSSRLRDAKKIRFYIEAEIARLEALELRYGGCAKPTVIVGDPNMPANVREAFAAGLAAVAKEPATPKVYNTAHGPVTVTLAPSEPWVVSPVKEPAAPKLFSELCAEFDAAIKPELEKLLEPAAQIDDESDSQKAVEQNGNDGAVYEDPWYGAPEWARFKAQDGDGEWRWFKCRPTEGKYRWHDYADDSIAMHAAPGELNPNWRDTLIERTSG